MRVVYVEASRESQVILSGMYWPSASMMPAVFAKHRSSNDGVLLSYGTAHGHGVHRAVVAKASLFHLIISTSRILYDIYAVKAKQTLKLTLNTVRPIAAVTSSHVRRASGYKPTLLHGVLVIMQSAKAPR